ncbi:MAG TPA: M3 family oligoendopeptidase [Acidimicrobiales bacterium]|jgi:oligoendopeptidase F|nr:M3 family oligoendopeptidase [Acidimicrobiales bacterium]
MATDVNTVHWDLSDLLDGAADDQAEAKIEELLAEAERMAEELAGVRGTVSSMDAHALGEFMRCQSQLQELLGRAGSYASLRFAVDTTDPKTGALMQKVQERSTQIATRLIFFDLEWTALPDDHAERLLADDGLAFARHHLRTVRAYKPHLLSEAEEKILTEKAVTGRSAWARLFSQETSAIEVTLDGEKTTLDQVLSRLGHPDREVRRTAAEAVTEGLKPGLRTRAYIFNTLLADKATDDRLRNYETWISSRNLSNEASDESVETLVSSVQKRYDIPQRWYALKAKVLGLDKIADYDRMASVADTEEEISWDEGRQIVIDAYASFSEQAAATAELFFDKNWIDAPPAPGKRGGAFCAYTVPSVHPYVFLNWTNRRRDVMTLAHELGHALHAYLAREQGVYHQGTPLTLAETASVFGETVTFGRVLESVQDPNERLALLASNIEDSIATIFRQTAMNRFENSVHTARRTEGELSVERFGELWAASQTEMLGDAVEVTEGYRTWWSYIPHFIGTPGYVYAYAYGQLLALSVYKQYQEQGSDFVPRYLHMLSSGGSMAPEDLGKIVGCDLADPHFWDGGLDIVEQALEAAEQAAFEAGRLR